MVVKPLKPRMPSATAPRKLAAPPEDSGASDTLSKAQPEAHSPPMASTARPATFTSAITKEKVSMKRLPRMFTTKANSSRPTPSDGMIQSGRSPPTARVA